MQGLGRAPSLLAFAVDLLHRMPVVLGEVGCDAHQPRRAPVNLVSGGRAQRFHHQQLELRLVVHQPVQVEQALVDDVLGHRALVAYFGERDR